MRGTLMTLPSRGPRVEIPLRTDARPGEGRSGRRSGRDCSRIRYDRARRHGRALCRVSRQRKQSQEPTPINRDATILWDAALVRAGYPGLLKPGGQIADYPCGQVAVVLGDAEFMAAPG